MTVTEKIRTYDAIRDNVDKISKNIMIQTGRMLSSVAAGCCRISGDIIKNGFESLHQIDEEMHRIPGVIENGVRSGFETINSGISENLSPESTARTAKEIGKVAGEIVLGVTLMGAATGVGMAADVDGMEKKREISHKANPISESITSNIDYNNGITVKNRQDVKGSAKLGIFSLNSKKVVEKEMLVSNSGGEGHCRHNRKLKISGDITKRLIVATVIEDNSDVKNNAGYGMISPGHTPAGNIPGAIDRRRTMGGRIEYNAGPSKFSLSGNRSDNVGRKGSKLGLSWSYSGRNFQMGLVREVETDHVKNKMFNTGVKLSRRLKHLGRANVEFRINESVHGKETILRLNLRSESGNTNLRPFVDYESQSGAANFDILSAGFNKKTGSGSVGIKIFSRRDHAGSIGKTNGIFINYSGRF